jgi:beta-galactosidase
MKKIFITIGLLMIVQLGMAKVVSLPPEQSKTPKNFKRMGSIDTQSFDENWLFSRYGLQADGTSVPEPENLETPGLNDKAWRQLNLPHDWAIEGPFRIELKGNTGKLPYKGIGWYRKHFTVPSSDAGKQVFIDFDGAMSYSEVWLNGKYVGGWPYGYTSFRLELTPYLNIGKENVIAVKLNTEKWDSRWYPGAGIYRHVWLVKTQAVHVAQWGVFITTPKVSEKSATVKMDVKVENQDKVLKEVLIETTVFELDANNQRRKSVMTFEPRTLKVEAGGTVTTTTEAIMKNPKLWSLSSPSRYIAFTTVKAQGKVVDIYSTSFGIRTIEFTPRKGFLLNGKRVEIQGVCNHHDLGALGGAMNTSALRRQLTILKGFGCNSIRTSHNPPAPELLELADQMGFLIMDEAFD